MNTLTIKSEEPVVIVPVREYESMQETLEILSDKGIMKQIRESEECRKQGKKAVDFEVIKKKAGF